MFNFNINLNELGDLPMTNIFLIGTIVIICVFIWQFSNIINAITHAIKTSNDIENQRKNHFFNKQ